MTREERKRLRELVDKATPGPWTEEPLNALLRFGRKQDGPWCDHDGVCPDDADAEFIAAARTAVPALLDALERSERKLSNQEALEAHFYRQFKDLCGLTVTDHSDVDVALRALRFDADATDTLKAENAALRERVAALEKVREAGVGILTRVDPRGPYQFAEWDALRAALDKAGEK